MSDPIVRPVPGFEPFYAVSEDGRVFSLNYRRTGKMVELAQASLHDLRRTSETFYRRVKAYHINPKTPTPVHRLVALAWVPNPFGLPQVNHIDGDKGNNHASNLEWVDNSRNQKHAHKHGLHAYPKGEDHHMAILTEDQVREIRAELQADGSRGQGLALAHRYGVSASCISDIRRGRAWGHVA